MLRAPYTRTLTLKAHTLDDTSPMMTLTSRVACTRPMLRLPLGSSMDASAVMDQGMAMAIPSYFLSQGPRRLRTGVVLAGQPRPRRRSRSWPRTPRRLIAGGEGVRQGGRSGSERTVATIPPPVTPPPYAATPRPAVATFASHTPLSCALTSLRVAFGAGARRLTGVVAGWSVPKLSLPQRGITIGCGYAAAASSPLGRVKHLTLCLDISGHLTAGHPNVLGMTAIDEDIDPPDDAGTRMGLDIASTIREAATGVRALEPQSYGKHAASGD